MKRVLLISAGVVGCIWLGARPATTAPARHIEPLQRFATPLAGLPVPGLKFGKPTPGLVKNGAPPGTFWGGPLTASSGDVVQVFSSDSYPEDDVDQARLQSIADFVGGLPHGAEISSVDIYVVDPSALPADCGEGSLSCYDPGDNDRGVIVIPGEFPAGVQGMEALTHEYGHQIAAHRNNDPWAASTWGPKSWATAMHVCQRFAAGTADPGDEGQGYKLNPGEAWAETYRLAVWGANARLPLSVDQSFAPTKAALAAALRDVRHPWTGTTTLQLRGRFLAAARGSAAARAETPRSTSLVLPTPLDGLFTAQIAGPSGASIGLVDPVTGKAFRSPYRTVGMTVCGTRSVRLVLHSRATGRFTVHVQRP